MAAVTGIHHINLRACGRDTWEKTVAFYTEVMGFTLYRQWDGRNGRNVMLKTGNCILEIMEEDMKRENGVIDHFALETDDVAGLIEKVREYGCVIDKEAKSVVLHSEPEMPIDFAFFYGLCGEYVEIFKERKED